MTVAAAEHTEPDYLDVDVVEDSGALPAGSAARRPSRGRRGGRPTNRRQGDTEEDLDETDDRTRPTTYEYVDDSSGLEPEDPRTRTMSPTRGRRAARLAAPALRHPRPPPRSAPASTPSASGC